MTGEELRRLRKFFKLTQRELAYQLGYRRPNTIARKEKGLRRISCQDIRIMQHLGMLPREYDDEYYG